jgi:Ca2+-binding RTX toxin-like protein
LVGSTGNDVLVGGSGSDTLWGGAGLDTLTGGSGADADFFGINNDDGSRDLVTDFYTATDVLILDTFTSLSGAGATINGSIGADVASFGDATVAANNYFGGADEGVFVAYDSLAGVTYVLADGNTDGVYDYAAEISGHVTMQGSNFTTQSGQTINFEVPAAPPAELVLSSDPANAASLAYITSGTPTATDFKDGTTVITLNMGQIDALVGWHKGLNFSSAADFLDTYVLISSNYSGSTTAPIDRDLYVLSSTMTGAIASNDLGTASGVDLATDTVFGWTGASGSTHETGSLIISTNGTDTFIWADIHLQRSAEVLSTVGVVDPDLYQRPVSNASDAYKLLTITGLNTPESVFTTADFVISGAIILDTITSGTGAHTLTGTSGGDGMHGGLGADTFIGGLGDDYLTGDAESVAGAADLFIVDAGHDHILDLAFGDVADIVSIAAGASVSADAYGNWSATAATKNDGFAEVDAQGYNIDLSLATGTNGWRITDANNVVGAGEILAGSTKADWISGGAGTDTLRGNAGVDTLTGGSSVDTFLFETTFDLNGSDLIADFTTVVDDIIKFNFGQGTNLAQADLRGSGIELQFGSGAQSLYSGTGMFVYTGAVADAAAADLVAEAFTGEVAGDIIYLLTSTAPSSLAQATLYSVNYTGVDAATLNVLGVFDNMRVSDIGINNFTQFSWL